MSAPTAVSPWFTWHKNLFADGVSVLDLACGEGRHARAAAERGARVEAVEVDAERLARAKKAGRKHRRRIRWRVHDLERDPPPKGPFDVVMVFYYLDRQRFPTFLNAVKPGGHLLAETFLEQQRTLESGPTSDDHLLGQGELVSLVRPFQIVHAREVLEIIDGRPRFVASVLARHLTK